MTAPWDRASPLLCDLPLPENSTILISLELVIRQAARCWRHFMRLTLLFIHAGGTVAFSGLSIEKIASVPQFPHLYAAGNDSFYLSCYEACVSLMT